MEGGRRCAHRALVSVRFGAKPPICGFCEETEGCGRIRGLMLSQNHLPDHKPETQELLALQGECESRSAVASSQSIAAPEQASTPASSEGMEKAAPHEEIVLTKAGAATPQTPAQRSKKLRQRQKKAEVMRIEVPLHRSYSTELTRWARQAGLSRTHLAAFALRWLLTNASLPTIATEAKMEAGASKQARRTI